MRQPPIRIEVVGRPTALSSLARLLLQLHATPPVAPVQPQPEPTHEQPQRDPVSALVEGPQ